MSTASQPVSWKDSFRFCCQAGKRPLAWMAGLAVLQAVLPLAGLYAMMFLVDAVADGIAGRVSRENAWQTALWATGIAASVALLGGVLRSVAAVVNENHGRLLGDAGVQRLQEHTAQLELAEFDKPGFHDAMQRAGQEAGQRPVRLLQDLTAWTVAVLSLLMMTALLAQVELWLPVVVGAAAVPIAWARRKHARIRFGWHRDHVVEQREVGYLGASLSGRATAKDVRVLGLAKPFAARLGQLRARLRASLARLARHKARDELLVHLLASAALFGAYVYLAADALAGAMTLGGLVLHAQAAQRTQNAVRDLLAASAGVHEHRLFLRPLVDFLALPHANRPAAGPVEDAPSSPAELCAAGLGFRYPEMPRDVLDDVSFTIAPGERVAIIGPNGSGKSTLIKLLCGLYPTTRGALRIDAESIHGCDPERLRQRVAVLLQDASAFELTLRENLQLGHPSPPDDEALLLALDLVGLGDRVRELPMGLDAPWSRRLRGGVDWSVGEARRIVLARTLTRAADVLLLDEPFASLDGETAAGLSAWLREQPRTRTVVLVDHRGPALACVDRVLWLDRGRLVADAAPPDLAKIPGFAEQFPDWEGLAGPG